MAQISNNFDYYADQLGLNLNNYIVNYDFKKTGSISNQLFSGYQNNNRFGWNADISNDGNVVIFGAPTVSSSGYADIFTGNNSNYSFAKRLTGDGGLDQFGYSVALNSNGNIALIGGINDNGGSSGAAWIFTGNGSDWSLAKKITGASGANSYFGSTVALSEDGKVAIVGARGEAINRGSVYVFTGNGSNWNISQLLTGSQADASYFGWNMKITPDAKSLLIGAYIENASRGAAYLFTGNNYNYSFANKFTGIGQTNDFFGVGVDMTDDGKNIVISEISTKNIYLFTGSGSNWNTGSIITFDPNLSVVLRDSLKINNMADTIYIGLSNPNTFASGQVHIYTKNNSNWSLNKILSGNLTDDRFGNSISLSSSSNTVLIGAPSSSNAGSGYIYNFNSYIQNKSVFSGLYTGLIRNDNSFFYNQGNVIDFNGTNSVKVQNSTGLKNDFFTVYCAYEKTGSGQAVLFSTLDTAGSNIYSGFNFGITSFNNFYYEYYDNTYGPRTHITNAKANTAGIVSVNKNINNVNINFYDPTTEAFLYESFPIQTDTNNFSHLTIGSAKVLPFFSGKNYIGKINQFIFLQESLSASYLNDLADGFIYDINKTVTLSTFEELYSYSGLTNNLTGAVFDSSSGISFTCLNDYSFYDNLGIINGSISGNIVGSNHTASGFFTGYTSQAFNYTNSINRFFSNIVITGSVTGYELQISGTGLTGTVNINAGEIINICNSGVPLVFISGLTGVLSGYVITGIDYLTGLVTGIETITNSNFTQLINFPFSGNVGRNFASSVVTGKYIYNFTIENNGNYITKTEDITFTNQYITGAFISKTSNLTINRGTSFIKNTGYLNSIGINKIMYNRILDSKDIVEIYAFEFNPTYSPILNQPAEFNIGSSRFRILENQNISNVSNNGVYNIDYNDYANIFDYKIDDIANVSGNYDSIDNILLDYNKTGFLFYSYTGGNVILTGKKDFLYLNGQKLISGINYIQSGSNSYTNINNTNVSITGNITAYNSVLNYILLTGNRYSYTLPRLYPKNTSSVYINGVKQDRIDFIEKSNFDPINDPLFLENKGKNIYNTDSALEVNK
jgi:hypothetical protein